VRVPRGPIVRVGIGLAISIVSLWLVLGTVNLPEAWQVIKTADPAWLAVGLLCLTADVLVRAVRWQRLVLPIKAVRYLPILQYTLVGYLANNVLPARLGELVRCHYLGDRENISRASALGTVVVERVVDAAVVVSIAAVAILVLNVRGVVASAILVGLAIVGLLVVALAIGIAAHRLPGAQRLATVIERWPSVVEAARRLRDGLAVAGRPRTLAEALVLSVVAWGATVAAFAAIGQAIGLHLLIGEAALLAAGVALATAIPSGPGYLGTYELAAVKIAEALGQSTEEAFALALLAHASVLILTSVGGAIAFIRLGWTSSVHEVGEVVEEVLGGSPDAEVDPAS
jgi:glycosyltransferase 2 family protein